ncbi:50S ribosomal protein L21 [uncultured Campylobacter sp.]|uniref:50S ribosomal protein L21 n=1 Tax=uncultured Campylobacter sp. TaxID=218934 RepID=UPI002603A9A0|nr:50S ribosomal protein L21 [uncultured Campylobacter sp.]
MYAVIKHGGKQYRVSKGDSLRLDRFDAKVGDSIDIDEVLALSGDSIKVGAPYVKGAKVVLKVVEIGRDKKVIIFKKRRRKDSKLKRGFRRAFTRVIVEDIVG